MEDQPIIDQQVIDLPVMDQQVMNQVIEQMIIDEEVLEQMTADQIEDQMIMEQEVMDQLAKNPGSRITLKQDHGFFYPEVSCPLLLLEANSKNTKGIITRYLTNLLEKSTFKGKEYLISAHYEFLDSISETADKFIYAYKYLMDNVGRENLEGSYDEDDLYIEKYNYHYFVPYMLNLLFEQATD